MVKRMQKYAGLIGFVVFPMFAVIFYYLFFAVDRYVSETIITVRQADSASSPDLTGLTILAGVNPSSKEDTLFLREYIHSLDMLKILDKELKLRNAYSAQTSDPFFRLYNGMSQEWFLWYYRNRTQVVYDDMTGLLHIKSEAFNPAMAQKINKTILVESERFVNELSHKMSREQMLFADSELIKAKERYAKAKSELLNFQNRYGVFDPLLQAQSKATLSESIEATVAQKEAELGTMLSFLQDSAPEVVALKAEIVALKNQAAKEKSVIASLRPGEKLNDLAARYHDLMIEAGFAEDAYKIALASAEKTRLEASRKVKQLAVIQMPVLPENAEYPDRIYNLITIFIALMLLYGIVNLIKATIEDHKY